jgi:hypothetical protein
MKTGRELLALLTGFLLLLAVSTTVFAEQDLLNDIRKQSAIASSYNFDPLPSSAGEGVTVAIVSQGITHKVKDLLGDRLSITSVMSDDTSPYDDGDFGIGNGMVTLVAALAPKAKIINIKALDTMGGGSYESIRDGISRATELGAKIMILPIGASKGDDGVTNAVNAALAKGILVVASAGNEPGGAIQFPSNMDGVLAIGGSTEKRRVAAFSSIGDKVIFAPGEDVMAIEQNNKLGPHSGTTQSAGVAGAICAVLWSQDMSLTREKLVEFVQKSTREIEKIGGGKVKLIDGAAALRAITDAKTAAATK